MRMSTLLEIERCSWIHNGCWTTIIWNIAKTGKWII